MAINREEVLMKKILEAGVTQERIDAFIEDREKRSTIFVKNKTLLMLEAARHFKVETGLSPTKQPSQNQGSGKRYNQEVKQYNNMPADEVCKVDAIKGNSYDGVNFVAYLIGIEEATAKTGNDFLKLTFLDDTGTIVACVFGDSVQTIKLQKWKLMAPVHVDNMGTKDGKGESFIKFSYKTIMQERGPNDPPLTPFDKLVTSSAVLEHDSVGMIHGISLDYPVEGKQFAACPEHKTRVSERDGFVCDRCHSAVTPIMLTRMNFTVGDEAGMTSVSIAPWHIDKYKDIEPGEFMLVRGFYSERDVLYAKAIFRLGSASYSEEEKPEPEPVEEAREPETIGELTELHPNRTYTELGKLVTDKKAKLKNIITLSAACKLVNADLKEMKKQMVKPLPGLSEVYTIKDLDFSDDDGVGVLETDKENAQRFALTVLRNRDTVSSYTPGEMMAAIHRLEKECYKMEAVVWYLMFNDLADVKKVGDTVKLVLKEKA